MNAGVGLAPDALERVGVGVEDRDGRALLSRKLPSDDATDETGTEYGYPHVIPLRYPIGGRDFP